MLSHVLFHPHSLQSLSPDSCPRNEQVHRCFLVVQQGVQFIFQHALINSGEGGAGGRTYLWVKLLSFLRQWRVTILWPSLLTSWLTVHATGLLARAPRNATPSFSLTLKRAKSVKLDDAGSVTTDCVSEPQKHTRPRLLSLSMTRENTAKGRRGTRWCFNCLS